MAKHPRDSPKGLNPKPVPKAINYARYFAALHPGVAVRASQKMSSPIRATYWRPLRSFQHDQHRSLIFPHSLHVHNTSKSFILTKFCPRLCSFISSGRGIFGWFMPGVQWQILRKLQLELETSTVQSEGVCGFRVYDGCIIGRRLALSLRDLFVAATGKTHSLVITSKVLCRTMSTPQTAHPANRQVVLSSLGFWVLGCGMHLPLLNSRHTCSPLSVGVKV